VLAWPRLNPVGSVCSPVMQAAFGEDSFDSRVGLAGATLDWFMICLLGLGNPGFAWADFG